MLRGLIALVVFLVATVVLGAIATVVSLLVPRADATLRLGKIWARVMLVATGARVRYEGTEHAAASLPCVYISNHQSLVDVWALLPALPNAVRFVAKRSLFRIPFLGWSLWAGGFIPIDRGHRARAIRSLEVAAERIRNGRPVLLFAEGTRSRDGRLAPFKRGAFHLAVRAGVPVVPVAVSGTYDILRPRTLVVRPGSVTIRFGEPIDVGAYRPDDVDGLLERVRASVVAMLAASEPAERVDPLIR